MNVAFQRFHYTISKCHTHKKVVDLLFFWWFDGQIYTTSYRSNSFKFKSASEGKKREHRVRSSKVGASNQIKHHTQTNHTATVYRYLLPFFQLILIWNFGLETRTYFLCHRTISLNSIALLFICRFLSSVSCECVVCVCVAVFVHCTVSQSAFAFIIECALDWFMARSNTNLLLVSVDLFIHRFFFTSSSCEPCLCDRFLSYFFFRRAFFFIFFLFFLYVID